MVKRLIVLSMVLVLGGANCDALRTEGVARSDAVKLLRAPVLCEGSPSDGYICGDNKGGLVTCPAKLADPCKVVAGRVETPAP